MKNQKIVIKILTILIVFNMFFACSEEEADKYNVAFLAGGGNPEPKNQIINRGGKVIEPAAMVKEGFVFDGWYPLFYSHSSQWNFNVDTVTADITLICKMVCKPLYR